MQKLEATMRVFLAHARSDHEFAARLTAALAGAGVHAWDPSAEILFGEDPEESILAHLRDSDLVVFVVPEREGAGKNALAELGAAYALGKPIVAITPNSARADNAEIGRLLSGSAVVDASILRDNDLVSAIMMPLAA